MATAMAIQPRTKETIGLSSSPLCARARIANRIIPLNKSRPPAASNKFRPVLDAGWFMSRDYMGRTMTAPSLSIARFGKPRHYPVHNRSRDVRPEPFRGLTMRARQTMPTPRQRPNKKGSLAPVTGFSMAAPRPSAPNSMSAQPESEVFRPAVTRSARPCV